MARTCIDCSQPLATDEGTRCNHCAGARNDARRAGRLHSRQKKCAEFGVSLEEMAVWDRLCETGTCDICGLPALENSYQKLSRDHAHTKPPFPRGCLCTRCNNLLGAFEEVLARGGMRPLDPANPFCRYLVARDYRYRSTDA